MRMAPVGPIVLLVALRLAAATYEDPEGKFHFDLPSGWTAKVQGRLPEETPLTFSKGEFSCDLTVLAQEGGGTIQEAASEIESALVGQGDVVREEASVDGTPAERIALTPDDTSLGVTVMLVVVTVEARLVVELRADRNAWRRDRAQYDAVLSGFHMGQPKSASGNYRHLALEDDGSQILPGSPPLTNREVSGCLGAVEFAYGIELTLDEMHRLKLALEEVFRSGDSSAAQALTALSEEGWRAREAVGESAETARKAIGETIKSGETGFHRETAKVVASASSVGGKPAEHDRAVVEEWIEFVWALAAKDMTIGPSPAWTSWAESDDAIGDVELMALRAALSMASAADLEAYSARLIEVLGGSEEKAIETMTGVAEKDVPELAARLRDAGRPLIETLTPKVDLAEPSRNGAIRYKY